MAGPSMKAGLITLPATLMGFMSRTCWVHRQSPARTFKRSNTRQFYMVNSTATNFAGAPDQLTVNNTQWNTQNVNTIPNNTQCSGDHLSVSADTGGNFRLIVNNTGGANVCKTGGACVQAGENGTGKMDAQVS